MVTCSRPNHSSEPDPSWHQRFLSMLPAIRRTARLAFRHLPPEARDEAVADVIANALVAFVRLAEQGKTDVIYPTVLARYGIAQYRVGRRVGTKLNIRDVGSPYCRAMKGVGVKCLDHYDPEEGTWKEILIEDRTAGPAELAASRIDFPAWLGTLSRRNRKLAMKLANGEQTGSVAKLLRISAARVSQLRRELMDSWQKFVGDEPVPVIA